MAKTSGATKNNSATTEGQSSGLKVALLGKKITFEGLRKFNLIMAALHALQGIAVVLLSDANRGIQQVSTNFLSVDTMVSQGTGHTVLSAASRILFDVNLAYLVAAFFFMSAIAHLVIATVARNRYETDLKKGINKFRWIEYSLSASTMMVAIGFLSGIFDLSTLVAIFALIAVMNLMGLAMELHNQDSKVVRWTTFWIGCIAGIIPWVIFAIYVWGAAVYGDGKIPTFVYPIYASIFIFFNCFAVNMWLQYKKKGPWANYLFGERMYIVLSLVAKSALAWQVFFGTLRP